MPFIELEIFDNTFQFECDDNGKIIDDSPIVYFLDKNNSFYFGEDSFEDGDFEINEFYKKSREIIKNFPEEESYINIEYINYYLRHYLLYDNAKKFKEIKNVVSVNINDIDIPIPNKKEKNKLNK